jgi:hypothetical protein
MNERYHAAGHHISTGDRQVLAAAYLPVIAIGAALIAARIAHTRRHPLQAALR